MDKDNVRQYRDLFDAIERAFPQVEKDEIMEWLAWAIDGDRLLTLKGFTDWKNTGSNSL